MGRHIVPRLNMDSDLGTETKKWNNVFANTVKSNIIILNGSDLQALLDGKTDLSTLTAKGDLYVATDAGVLTRLPKGNDGEILKVNSGTTEGLEWAPGGQRVELTSDITVTVGSGGNYPTINDALESIVALYYPKYISGNNCPKVTINLLAGFTMAEQVLVEGLDLSWITITGDDAETVIQRDALTTSFVDGYPAFGVSRGFLPVIGQLFTMDTSGLADNRNGVIAGNCSKAVINSGSGIKNAGRRGIYALWASLVEARGANVSGAGAEGITAANGSTINAYSVNASGAGARGINVNYNSMINANNANLTNCGNYGIYCAGGSIVSVDNADASNAGTYGIALYGGSIISALTATGTLNQTANTITANGIIFQ